MFNLLARIGFFNREASRTRNAFLKQLVRRHSLTTFALCAGLCAIHLVLVLTGCLPTNPTGVDLYKMGGGFGPSVAHGQAWRLVTSIFLHAGFDHLIGNCIGLIAGGLLVDWLVGSRSLLAIYFLGGCFGAMLSAIFHPGAVTVGASGAIFSVYGAIIAGLVFSARLREQKATRFFFIAALIHALLALHAGLQDTKHVDNFAHLGGFFAGFAITCVWYLNKNDAKHRQMTFLGTSAFLLAVGLFIVPRSIRSDRMDPIRAEVEHKENIRRMKAVEALTIQYSAEMKTKSEPEAVHYTRDVFLPRYTSALKELERSLDDEAPTPKEAKVKEIVYGVYSRCSQIYKFIATEGREPASFEGRRPRVQDFIADCKHAQVEADASIQRLHDR